MTGRAFAGAEDLEAGSLGDGGFDAQDAARLVVHFDGVAIGPVLDADAFLAPLQARGELAFEVVMNAGAAEEAHDVGTLEVKHRVTDERRVDRPEGRCVTEDEIGGPFGLIGRPIVALGPGLEDARMERVESACDGIEDAFPRDGELLVEEALGESGGSPSAVKQLS